MLTSVVALALIVAAASGLSVLCKKSTVECLPMCFCGTICLLYVFYCFGAVRIGLFLAVIIMAALYLAAWRKIGKIKELLLQSVSPGMVVYLGISLLVALFVCRNYVSRHDELRMWGAVPKAIFETGKLQLGDNIPIFSLMQSYPPGFPLIGYFFSSFSSEFSEGALFIAYSCMAFAFFVSGMSSWKRTCWPLLAPVGLLLLAAPCVFTSHLGDYGMFGMTLFVDPLLGILAGYVFYLAGHKPFQDGFSKAAFCCGLAVLCLCKNTGALFAAMAAIIAVVLEPGVHSFLMTVGAVVFGYGSWNVLLRVYEVRDHVGLALHSLSASAVRNVLHGLISENMVAHGIPAGFLLSFVSVFAVLWLLYFAAYRLSAERNGKRSIVTALGMLTASACFVYGYALIYGETMESFTRYMATPLLCLFTCILLMLLPSAESEKVEAWLLRQKKSTGIVAACICIAVSAGFLTVWCWFFPALPTRETADQDADQIRAAVAQDSNSSGTGKIYLVIAGDSLETSHYHHRIYFDLISDEMYIGSWYMQSRVLDTESDDPAKAWADELQEDYEYVYLLSVEDDLRPVFSKLSEDLPEEHCLYRVVAAENDYGIALEKV